MPTHRIPLLATLLVATALALPAPPAAAGNPFFIAPGFDLFETDPAETSVGIPNVLTLTHFRGVPVGTYDFGAGPVAVGTTDTIVRRGPASVGNPVAQVELVMLQLQGIERPDLFVTLQSDRGRHLADPPSTAPSTGLLQIQFQPNGSGGTFTSQINVNFDVRTGSVAGPILASASLLLNTEGTPWQHVLDAVRCMTHPEFATHADVLARHGICGPSAVQPGVNHKLNGVDEDSDFHPGVRRP